jgi:membrane-associated phospholipid phosphatase
MGVGTHGHWSVQVVGGWMGVGCSKSLLFLYAKKNDPFGGKKDNNHNPNIKERTSNPFYPL